MAVYCVMVLLLPLVVPSLCCVDKRVTLLTPGPPGRYKICHHMPERCVTFNECVNNPDRCFGSCSVAQLLPGNYTLTAPVIISDVINLNLSVYSGLDAHSSECEDSQHANSSEKHLNDRHYADAGGICGKRCTHNTMATVTCSGEAGFLFVNVSLLLMSDIYLAYCGFAINTSEVVARTHYKQRYLKNSYTAGLQLMLTSQTILHNLHISNSTGNGIFWINPFHSGIDNSVITSTNYQYMQKQLSGEINCFNNTKCNGGNVWIVFVDTECPSEVPKTEFFIQNTEISYGVNLNNYILGPRFAAGLGIMLSQSAFDVNVDIQHCTIHHNVADAGANTYFRVMYFISNSVINVLHTNLSDGNKPFTDPKFMEYCDQAGGMYLDINSENVLNVPTSNQSDLHLCNNQTSKSTNTTIVLDNVSAMRNRGGGIKIYTVDAGQPCCFNVTLKNTHIVGTEEYYYTQGFRTSIALFIQEDRIGDHGSLNVTLSSVVISNSYVVNDTGEEKEELSHFPKIGTVLLYRVLYLYLINTTIESNSETGLLAISSAIHFVGSNTLRNNSGSRGGAISLKGDSQLYLHPHSHLSITDNIANYGGGIMINSGNVRDYPGNCFYQLIPIDPNDILSCKARVVMKNNTARKAGHSLYGGNYYGPANDITGCSQVHQNLVHISKQISDKRIFTETFHVERVRASEFSSTALGICFCHRNECDIGMPTFHASLFPGETLSIEATGLGYVNGTAPGAVYLQLQSLSHESVLDHHISVLNSTELQDVNTVCTKLQYTILSPENMTNIGLHLQAQGSAFQHGFSKSVNITTKTCPTGFRIRNYRCLCSPALRDLSVECNINNQSFSHGGSVWVDFSDQVVSYHKHCLPTHCKTSQVHFRANESDHQCQDHRTGTLCGACEASFSIALGSSRCLKCSNSSLGLIVVFVFAGLLLVVFLATLDLTVARGTINGLIFYVNILQASQETFGMVPYRSRFASVFIAWLNLDFGIDACFYNGLDIYTKTLLQFAFPVYIWLLAAFIIISSHYYSFMARLSGSNIVPVLATLFLLSYGKILRAVIAVFSFTIIWREDGTSVAVWLYDGNMRYLREPHLILFIISIIFTVLFLLPLLLLTLFTTCLQTSTNRVAERFTMKLKPLLDAYQGQYKDRYRFWTGIMLLLQTLLLVGFSLNESRDPGIVLFAIIISNSTVLFLSLLGNGGMYRSLFLTGVHCFYMYNLVLIASWSLFNHYYFADEDELRKWQGLGVNVTTGMAAFVFGGLLLYHVYTKPPIKMWLALLIARIRMRLTDNSNAETSIPVFTTDNTGTETAPLLGPTMSVVSIRQSSGRSSKSQYTRIQ